MAAPPSKRLLVERAAVWSAGAALITAVASAINAVPGNKQEATTRADAPAVQRSAENANGTAAQSNQDVNQSTKTADTHSPPPAIIPLMSPPPPPQQVALPPARPMLRRAMTNSRDYNVYLRKQPSPTGQIMGYIQPDELLSVLWRDGDYLRVRTGKREGYIRTEMVKILDGQLETLPSAQAKKAEGAK